MGVSFYRKVTVKPPAHRCHGRQALFSGQPTEGLAKRARLLLVIDEVRAGHLTRPGAARALDMTLDDFLIQAGQHGLYAIDHDVDDFKREIGAIPKNRG